MRVVDWQMTAAFAALSIALIWGNAAASQSREQARELCLEKVRPAVTSCVRDQVSKSGGDPKSYVEGCKQSQTEPFLNCMTSALARKPDEDGSAPSQSRVQATEACLQKFQPSVTSCVRKRVEESGGEARSYIEECKKPLAEPFRDCIVSMLTKSAGRASQSASARSRVPYTFDVCFANCVFKAWTADECQRGCTGRTMRTHR